MQDAVWLSRQDPPQLAQRHQRPIRPIQWQRCGQLPSTIDLFDVSQPSIAHGRTKSIAEVIYCGRNSSVFVLTQVICDAEIIANLKQIRKFIRINALMKISTRISICTTSTILAIINSCQNIKVSKTKLIL